MRSSWFDRPWFYPAVVASFVAGNAFDLLGTYIHQPSFEHEANPLYVTLRPYGLRLNWPMVIVGKVIVCLICAVVLRLFLIRRRRYYPERPSSFREFLTHFLYGRPLGWIESCFKWPWSLTPGTLFIFAVVSLCGPFFAYLGYANLASEYGWWQLGGFWAGRYWIDWSWPVWTSVAMIGFCWLLWRDYRSVQRPEPLQVTGEPI